MLVDRDNLDFLFGVTDASDKDDLGKVMRSPELYLGLYLLSRREERTGADLSPKTPSGLSESVESIGTGDKDVDDSCKGTSELLDDTTLE